MAPIEQLISRLRTQGIRLWADGDTIRYEAPKGSMTASLREQLRRHKPALVTFLQQEQTPSLAPPALLPQVPREQPLPLSYAQERLWLLSHLEGAKTAYNFPGSLRFVGHLDRAVLQQSWQEIVQRHAVLRTNFVTHQGVVSQVIHPTLTIDLPVLSLTALPEAAQAREMRRLAAAEAERPFDLAHDPLLRFLLVQTAPTSHTLLWTTHHIVFDGWSINLLLRELSILYDSFGRGLPSPLPALPVQYADFALWQRQGLHQEALQGQWQYWRQRLAGAPPVLALPYDRPRPPQMSYRGASHYFAIDAALYQQVSHLSQALGTTPSMLLLAAFAILLARSSRLQDILIGSPVANRRRREFESVIGCFVNTLVWRFKVAPSLTFRDFVGQVRQTVLDGLTNQDVPFEQLVADLAPERHLSHMPLVQVMYIFQQEFDNALSFADLTVWPMEIDLDTAAKFDFSLYIIAGKDTVRGAMNYNRDLFDGTTIVRMCDHWLTLLSGLVAEPDQAITHVPWLTPAEQQHLLQVWGPQTSSGAAHQCLQHLFEAQVRHHPEALAAVYGASEQAEDQLTYEALNSRANQLAHHLISLGVGPEVLVGLCCERSLEMLVGILGILKAGGAYVPLDPTYPPDRLAYMIADAQISVIVTHHGYIDHWSGPGQCLVRLDTDAAMLARLSQANPVVSVTADHLAYVIYTSGTTGRPKGVLVTHANVARLLSSTQSWGHFEARDVWTLFHSYAFDFSVWEIWGALLYGGRLVVVPSWISRSPEAFYQLLCTQRVTILNQVPAAFLQLLAVDSHAARDALHLRLIILGGEALKPQSLQPWFARHGDQHPQVVNMYGITETTVHATSYVVAAADTTATGSPIGRPIPDLTVYVVDEHLQLVPVGVPGELCIGGAGVTRGYMGQPAMTAARFLPDPFSTQPGARLYRSGDMARLGPNGQLEYLGRRDQQTKIRGFRIEPGEIEASLAHHPHVHQAVVNTGEDQRGDTRLVAYVVPTPPVAAEATERHTSLTMTRELQSFLRERLPAYMVPSAFIYMDDMPLSANGKVDRRALPAPDGLRLDSDAGYTTAGNPTQDILMGIWVDVLGIERVGIHDNFFDLGGHSLLATQVMSRLRDHLAVDLPLRHLFESPTIAALSDLIDAAYGGDARPPLPALQPVPRTHRLPLSFAQQRLWFLEQLEGPSATYNMAGAMRLDGTLHLAAFEQSLTQMLARHEALRTSFPTHDGAPYQAITPTASVSLPLLDLQHLPPERQSVEVQRLAREEAQRPFDLSTGPLLRVALLRLSPQSHVLLITMHHMISDGWSIVIFIRELSVLYTAALRQDPAPLAPLPIQYADFATWQQQWLTGEVLARQLHFWTRQLGHAPPLLELPTDRPRPRVQTFHGHAVTWQVSAALSRQLTVLSRQQGTSLFMTLLAAFATLLAHYSGQRDLVIGTPIANRNHSATESLIGFFVNSLPLRLWLDGNPTVSQLLQQVRQVTLDAFAHQDVPFAHVVEALNPERSLSHSPLFQVMLILQNTPVASLVLPGLTLTPLVLDNATAKFDLTWEIEETAAGLTTRLEYNTDLFDVATIHRMAGHLQNLLTAFTANPHQPVMHIPLLSDSERQQVLVDWLPAPTPFPAHACLHHLFEQQVQRTPESCAIRFHPEDGPPLAMTFRSLNQRANQLAHFLRARGVTAETVVAVCFERSPDMLVGLLGILKAGGAYLPLDPYYPKDRLAFMLADAQAPLLLTQHALLPQLPHHAAQCICLDADWPGIARVSPENPAVPMQPQHPAYVIYTSGSTGQPKGVVGLHAGAVNRFTWMWQTYPFASHEVCCQKTSLSFVDSVWEIFGPLLQGVPSVLIPEPVVKDPHRLIDVLATQHVTRLLVVPSLLQALLDADPALSRALPQLTWWFTSGEALSLELCQRFYHTMLDARLINLYGSSEVAADVTAYDTSLSPSLSCMAIGRPIANSQTYLLDRYGQPVPIGVPADLYVGGAGLARGYLNRPRLTAEKFVPHPFSTVPGARLYHTGDRARYLPDGHIAFLGRADHQVKMRGYRIELGEIEAVLATHPAIMASVVLAREDHPGEVRLVAYAVPARPAPEPGAALKSHAVLDFLRTRLPDFMVPSALVWLDTLPLTPSRKLDRRALPTPQASSHDRQRRYVGPRTPTEQSLATIWTDILHVEPIGVHDDFFDLGGHSLSATQVVSRIRAVFATDLPVRHLFEHPTIAQLAEQLTAIAVQQAPSAALEHILAEIGGLSDEEVQRQLLASDEPF